MGPHDLRSTGPDGIATFWSQLPEGPDHDLTRSILRHVLLRLADVASVDAPSLFDDARSEPAIDVLVDAIPGAACTPDLLGMTCEQLMATGDRRSRGAHFTPKEVADAVTGHAVEQMDLTGDRSDVLVWDPAAGGGAFLLAAARRIERDTGWERSRIVRNIHASDIDPIALDVCSATLELWCGGLARPVVHCGDALLELPESWPTSFDLIVGNPPFLGQLTADTSRDATRRERLRVAFDDVAGGYVDESGLFLHVALARMSPRGVVALVLPESLLATRDAQPIRAGADRCASMAVLWIDDGQSFAAAVDVVAPVFIEGAPSHEETLVITGSADALITARPTDGAWSPLLATARGVPGVRRSVEAGVVGDLATVTAGFRQHFYGLAGAVREAPPDNGNDARTRREPQLVTAGAIDALWLRWGTRAVKFAGERWKAPVIDMQAIADVAVRQWFEDRRVPKLLLATQTKVLEVVGDPAGDLLPSVPTLSVEPTNADDLWRLAAVLSSPWASAWMAARSAGSGLSANAIRVRASEVATLPLPVEGDAWDEAARLAARAQQAAGEQDFGAHAAALRGLGEAMMEAYGGLDVSVIEWWWERLGRPEGSTDTAY